MSNSERWLPVTVLAYAASSLFHHIHNAEFLDEYPNLPAWLSRGGVYAAWCAVTAIGVGGVVCLWKGRRLPSLFLLGLYGACGLYGLAHYVIAPVAAHTMAANVSIWLEVITALLLVGLVATRVLREWRHEYGWRKRTG